jgi:Uma2 family endonuclease
VIETINIKALANSLTDEQFEQLCAQNRDTKFELTSQGELIVMSPTGSESGRQNGDLFGQIWYWNRQTKLGIVFDSSTGFTLPNDAKRSPDVSWIIKSRWDELTIKQKRKFAPLSPDFVIELLSPNDRLSDVQSKMTEYQACGVKLGWLIYPDEKRVEIYRLGKETEVLLEPKDLSGEDLMPKLTVDLQEIF